MQEKAFLYKTNLEEFGTGGYMMYRIPGIVVTNKGTVLAYYEARMGEGDWTKQDIYLRRSTDNGETWEERVLLVQGSSEETLHNAVMIVENIGDTLHFLWHKNYNRCFYQRSTDEGLHWTEPVEITHVFERFRGEYDWNVIAVGPGHGIQLKAGRLFVPAWLSTGGVHHRPSVLTCIYSDDGGDTWERGEIVWDKDGLVNPSETVAVQLENGNVLMNFRHESETHYRAVTVSKDGAAGWSKPTFDMQLPDPICSGSILRFTSADTKGENRVIFCNCANPALQGGHSRINLTIKLSKDECLSWQYGKLLEEFAGYSDIAVSPDKKSIYCFYERDWVMNSAYNTKFLTVARFNLEWLTDGKESL